MGLFDFLFSSNYTANNTNTKSSTGGSQQSSKIPNFSDEFSDELSSQMHDTDIVSFSSTGVRIHDIPDMVKLEYEGILAKNGAQDIFAVVGYGDSQNWEEVSYFPMQKTAQQTYELLTFRKKTGPLNVAFKDGADHWDNNSGQNYIFHEELDKGSH